MSPAPSGPETTRSSGWLSLADSVASFPGRAKRRLLMAFAGVGALVYLCAAIALDAHRLQAAVMRMGLSGCALVLLLSMGNYLLRFVRWRYYISCLGHHLPLWRHMAVYLSGFALTVSPGKSGEALRAVYMREYGVLYSQSIAALFCERLLDALAMILLAGLAVADARRHAPLLVGLLTLILTALALLGWDRTHLWLSAVASRHGGRIAKALASLASILRSSHRLLRADALLAGLTLALIAWAAEGLGFYLILHGLHLNLDLGSAIGIYAIGAIAGAAAFFLPGGIGSTELVMTTLLVNGGAPLASAIIATLLCRLATLWFAVVIGAISTLIVGASADRSARAEA